MCLRALYPGKLFWRRFKKVGIIRSWKRAEAEGKGQGEGRGKKRKLLRYGERAERFGENEAAAVLSDGGHMARYRVPNESKFGNGMNGTRTRGPVCPMRPEGAPALHSTGVNRVHRTGKTVRCSCVWTCARYSKIRGRNCLWKLERERCSFARFLLLEEQGSSEQGVAVSNWQCGHDRGKSLGPADLRKQLGSYYDKIFTDRNRRGKEFSSCSVVFAAVSRM